jgi:hypothetical protein
MLRATRNVLPSLTVATLAVAWLHAVPASNASAQSQAQPPGLSEPTPNVSDQKLDAAAAAIKQVITIKEDYEQRIEAAAPTDKERVAGEAKTALEKAVTDQGLSLPEYSAILVVAQNDPEVKEKILQRLRP